MHHHTSYAARIVCDCVSAAAVSGCNEGICRRLGKTLQQSWQLFKVLKS